MVAPQMVVNVSSSHTSPPPLDDNLPLVVEALTDSEVGRAILSDVIPELQSGAWRLLMCRITNVQKHGRKRLVFCQVSYRNEHNKRARSAQLVIKVDGKSKDRGGVALDAIQQLWAAGFRPPAAYRVPQPYGYSPERGILLQAMVRGTSWIDYFRSDDASLAHASARAAAWLIHLQRSPVYADVKPWERDMELAQKWSQELSTAFPQHAGRITALADQLLPQLRGDRVALVPSHGDYHPKNVFLTPRHTTVIDFDTFGLREAAFDVGYGMGQALSMSYFRLGGWETGARAALAFWQRYARDGQAPWPRVAVQVARTLLKNMHYALCPMQTKRVEMLELWPDLMEAMLSERGPVALERLVIPTTRESMVLSAAS